VTNNRQPILGQDKRWLERLGKECVCEGMAYFN